MTEEMIEQEVEEIDEYRTYKFDGLSEEAKAHAIQENYEIDVDYDWWDFTYGDAAETAHLKITGFDIYRRDVSGDLERSALDSAETIMKNHGAESDTYLLAQQYVQDYTVISVKYKLLDNEDSDDEDEAIEEIADQYKKDLLQCYLKMLSADYDYRTSDEAISESLRINEYDFDIDGNRN